MLREKKLRKTLKISKCKKWVHRYTFYFLIKIVTISFQSPYRSKVHRLSKQKTDKSPTDSIKLKRKSKENQKRQRVVNKGELATQLNTEKQTESLTGEIVETWNDVFAMKTEIMEFPALTNVKEENYVLPPILEETMDDCNTQSDWFNGEDDIDSTKWVSLKWLL